MNIQDKAHPACLEADYEGYAEHQARMAFEMLCTSAGGFENGKRRMMEIIKEEESRP